MKPKAVYLALCVLGTVLPYTRFLPFLREHGLNLRLFLEQLFATPISGFFAMKHLWAPLAANLAVGVSLGLPLFLYLREKRLEAGPGPM